MSHRRWQRGSLRIQGDAWYLRYRVDLVDPVTGLAKRAERTQRLGSATRPRAWAAAAARRIMRYAAPPAGLPGKAGSAAQAFEHYETHHLPLVKHSSQAAYRSLLRRHLRPAFKGLQLGQINTAVVQERLITPMRSAGLRRETITAAVVVLTRILKLAQTQGLAVGRFEPKHLVLPVAELRAERVYTPVETAAILSAELEPQQRAFFAVLLLTGLRCSEVLGLMWSDIDLQGRTLQIRRSAVAGRLGTCKTAATAAPRALSDQLVQRLVEYRAACPATASGLLFRSRRDRPLWRSHVDRSWLRPLLARLGIEPRGLHAARHAFGHAAAALGGAAQVRDLLRHRDLATTQRYVATVSTDLRRINQAVSDRLAATDKSGNAGSEVAQELRQASAPEP